MKNTTAEVIKIASKFDGRGFKQAETAADKLAKSVKTVGKAFGYSLGAALIGRSARAVVSAFAEEQRSAIRLASVMNNLGLSFNVPQMEKFIENLSLASGIADDQLRPAMQRLLQVTGSVTKSQQMLQTAIETSRATGIDLVTVAQDLGNAFVGNTRGLRKYGLGLTQAELAAASFIDIQERFNTLFGGTAQDYLDSFAGKMERLAVAGGEAKEKIGQGLVDAFATIVGDGNLDLAIERIGNFAQKISNGISAVGRFIAVTKSLFTGQDTSKIFAKKAYTGAIPSISSFVATDQQKKAEKAAAARQKAIADSLKKQTKLLKEQTASKKASAIFDLQQINIIAALKGKISQEERTRLELQLAIIQGNDQEAIRLAGTLADAETRSKTLAELLRTLPTAKNPFEAWADYLNAIEKQVGRISGVTPATILSGQVTADQVLADSIAALTQANAMAASVGAPTVTVNVQGSVISENDLTNVVRNNLIDAYGSGKTSWFDRNLGTFG